MSRSPASRPGTCSTSRRCSTALVSAVLGALAIEWLRSRGGTAGDQALALVFYTGIALGVVLVSQRRCAERQPLPVPVRLDPDRDPHRPAGGRSSSAPRARDDRARSTAGSSRRCIDEEGSRVAGVPVGPLNVVVAALAALTVALSMRIVGILLDRRPDGAAGDRRQRVAWSLRSTLGLCDGDRTRLGARRPHDRRTTPTCRRADDRARHGSAVGVCASSSG